MSVDRGDLNVREHSHSIPETAATYDTEVVRAPAGMTPPAMEEIRVQRPEGVVRDAIHWGPVWAGFLTALTTLLILSVLGLAVGLTTVNAGAAATQGGPPADTGRNSAVWAAICGIIAFLLGGYVAARSAHVYRRGRAAMNGVMVFLLTVPITLWLAGQGLGLATGVLSNLAGSFVITPGQASQAANSVTPADVARTAETARTAAWATLVALLLGLGSSALGGLLGKRRAVMSGQTEAYVDPPAMPPPAPVPPAMPMEHTASDRIIVDRPRTSVRESKND
jgi:hypothetical protein